MVQKCCFFKENNFKKVTIFGNLCVILKFVLNTFLFVASFKVCFCLDFLFREIIISFICSYIGERWQGFVAKICHFR